MLWYAPNEKCICRCGYEDIADNLDLDPQLLCVRCPKCGKLMFVVEDT